MTERPKLVAGVDEVGRGALAGPVVAAACILDVQLFRRRSKEPCWSPFPKKKKGEFHITESNELSPAQRHYSFLWLTSNCSFGVGIVEAKIIDRIGIVRATERAMQIAVQELSKKREPELLLIDGRDPFTFPYPSQAIIRGDYTQPSIAAASIIAKVTRDLIMTDLAEEFSHYGFELHKGYGTAVHLSAIRKFGVSSLHRLTFLKSLMSEKTSSGLPARTKGKRQREKSASSVSALA